MRAANSFQIRRLLSATILAGMLCVATGPVHADEADDDFDRTIAPLLARRCLDCHNSSDKKGGLDLSRRESALAGGESGAVLEPGKADKSLLWQRIADDEMPPKKPLPADEKAVLKSWIARGAQWGISPIDTFRFTTERRAGYDWWSLQPLARAPLPAVKDTARPRSPIDRFVQAKLDERGLASSQSAERRTLVRRLSFDLLGLPPSPEEVGEFVADETPDAYERLVDRLLASPHFGERWARHWLDVAHFGESDGFEYDKLRQNAWPYRDWVVNAFNRDLPYDEFARLQVAGDVLRPNDDQALAATGFLVAGAFDGLTPAGDLMRQIMRHDELEDVVSIVSQTFLGLTVNCARCHDHKFDPIRQTEYYRLTSALAGVRRGERPVPPPPQIADLQLRIAEWLKQLAAIDDAARRDVLARRKTQQKSGAQGEGGSDRNGAKPPQPIAAWKFDRDLQDQIGGLHGTASGGAKLERGGVVLDGKQAYVATAPLKHELKAKTLEVWVSLATLAQAGGGAISVQTLDGATFDAIVFGEREPAVWMAGSNGFARTQSFAAPAETQADKQPVHIAIVYDADGTITGYRNGQPYGQPYKTNLQSFAPGAGQVVFGMRHGPVGGNKMLAGTILRAALYDRALRPDEVAASAGVDSDFVGEVELVAQLSPAQRTQRLSLQAQLAATQDQLNRYQAAKVFAVTPIAAPVMHLLARGNPLQKQDAVTPGGVASIIGISADFGLPADAPEAQRRRELAHWLTDPRNPLFARTMVNRVWHYHFGAGLVPTPNDLGFSGGRPTHPELLDWLAMELLGISEFGFRNAESDSEPASRGFNPQSAIRNPQSSWSLKKLHRQIVTSATFRQSSAPNPAAAKVDAENRGLWRKSPQRLEAEAVRDAILAVSGELNRQMGGPGYQDFRPFLRGGTQFFEPLDPAGSPFNRRSLYRTWARGGHNQLLDTFDCPDPSTAAPRRSVTTTPLQALSLLNNSFVLRMSDQFADRIRHDAGEDVARQITAAFELAYGRPPLPPEAAAAQPFVTEHGLPAFCRIVLNSNAFLFVD